MKLSLKGIARRIRRAAQGKIIRSKIFGRIRLCGLHFCDRAGRIIN